MTGNNERRRFARPDWGMAPPEAPDNAERRAMITLSLVPGIGSGRMRSLVSSMGSAQAALGASTAALASVPGVGPELAMQIASADCGEAVERQLARALEVDASMVAIGDARYPFLLRQIADPPAFLWVRGHLPEEAAPMRALAVVGTRRMSPYGERVAKELTEALVREGFSIVSGLAYGVDAAAHQAALDAGGRTIAALGSGVDRVYPAAHQRLAEALIDKGGALLSEYALGAPPDGVHFPRRNRIVSGLALGALIVEAYEEGGALITARLALEQNREVFAVPGSVHSPASAGAHRLIQKGEAKLAQCVEDILEELQIAPGATPRPAKPAPALTAGEKALCGALAAAAGPLHINTLCLTAGMEPSAALAHLLGLELKGVVKQMAGKNFFLTADVDG